MKVIHCPLCNAALKVVYSGEKYTGWKKCQCGEPIYIIATEDGRCATESLKEILNNSRGNVVKMIEYLIKNGDERRIEDVIFVAGKGVEPTIHKLAELKVLDKIGYAYKINAAFESYLSNYANIKKTAERDIIEDFLNEQFSN